MYLDYFALDRHPFRITPDPSLFFPGGQDGRGVILNALIYGITSGEGILKVVGEVGSGKTMLCRMLEEKLPETVEIVYIANPSLSAREILYAICMELKLEVSSATERLKAMHMLQDYLLTRHAQGGTVVVFIEEAQSMPLETLEEIRLLSNLETHQHKLMQIVLFGQPELDKILAQKNIRQLRERITHSFRLEPLTTQATGDYLIYRLKAAGCKRESVFSERAEKMIAKASSGLTRRINILADKSLLAAYADSPSRQPVRNSNAPMVLPRHVKAAIRDSDYKRVLSPWLLGGLGMAVLLVATITVVWLDFMPGLQKLTQQAQQIVAADNEPSRAAPPPQATTITQSVVSDSSEATAALLAGTADTTPATTLEAITGAESEPQVPDELPRQVIEEPVQAIATSITAESGRDPSNPQTETLTLASLESSDGFTPEPETATDVAMVETVVPQTPVAQPARPVVQAASPAEADAVQEEDARTQALVANLEENVRDEQSADGEDPDQASEISTVTVPAPVTLLPSGLAELRIEPSADWLRALDSKSGYTIQMFSVPFTNPGGLEDYLQVLQMESLLQDTYICFMPVSSPTSGRWQVMHQEFEGVTPARNFIEELPAYLQQHDPYVRNLNGVDCSYPVDTRD